MLALTPRHFDEPGAYLLLIELDASLSVTSPAPVVLAPGRYAYCGGYCWAPMALLFVAGVMNLVWVAAIAAFVLMEKEAPFGVATGRIAAVVFVFLGLRLIAVG